MALTAEARSHYENILDSIEDPAEREEVLAGIKYAHSDGRTSIVGYKDELRRLGQQSLGKTQEQTPPSPVPERGLIGDIVSDVARGTADLTRMGGYAIKTLDPDGGIDVVERVGVSLVDMADRSQKLSIMQPDASELAGQEGAIKSGIRSGIRSAVPSLAPTFAGAAAGAAVGSVVPGLGTAVGGITGAVLGNLGLFGLGTYGEKKQEYLDHGVSEDEAHSAALKQGLIEGGIEGAASFIGAKIFGMDRFLTQPLKQTVKELLHTPVSTFAKNLAKDTFLNEVPTEMLQSYLGTRVDIGVGMANEGDQWQAAVDSIIPAMTMSLLFGTGASGFSYVQKRRLVRDLNNLEKPDAREKAAEMIEKGILEGDSKEEAGKEVELAEAWSKMAMERIDAGEAIDLNEDFIKFAQLDENSRKELQRGTELQQYQNQISSLQKRVSNLQQFQKPTDRQKELLSGYQADLETAQKGLADRMQAMEEEAAAQNQQAQDDFSGKQDPPPADEEMSTPQRFGKTEFVPGPEDDLNLETGQPVAPVTSTEELAETEQEAFVLKDLEQQAFIDKRVLELGSVEAVDQLYDNEDVVSQYARAKAREVFGQEASPDALKPLEESNSAAQPTIPETLENFSDQEQATEDNAAVELGSTDMENLSVQPGTQVAWQSETGETLTGELVRKTNDKWQILKPDGKSAFVDEGNLSLSENKGEALYSTTQDRAPGQGISLDDIRPRFKGQQIIQDGDSLDIRLKNGMNLKIAAIEHIGGDDYRFAVETGRIGRNGKIIGKATAKGFTLNKNLADSFARDHELIHTLELAGVLTQPDLMVLDGRADYFKRKGNLRFEWSEDNRENRANAMAQFLEDREQFRGTALGRVIQKATDFLDGILHIGWQSARKLAGGIETGKIFEKPAGESQAATLYQTSENRSAESDPKTFNQFVKRFMPGFKGDKSKLKAGFDKSRVEGEPFDLPETATLFETLKYNFVNQLEPLKKVQKAIEEKAGTIPEYADALTKEMLRISKTKAQMDATEEKHFTPIKRLVAVSGKKVKEVDDFLYARHAQEANARLRLTNARLYLRKLNDLRQNDKLAGEIENIDQQFEKDPFGTRQSLYFDLLEKELANPLGEAEQKFKARWEHFKSMPSGMTDAEAKQTLDKYSKHKGFQRIAEKFDTMNKERLDILLDAGRLSQEEYDAMRSTFKYYAPLKREGFNDGPSRGSGMQMMGKDIKIRGGSTKRAVNILANAMADFQAAQIKANKTEVARAFLKLIQENPHDGVWMIEPVRKVPGYDSAGNIVEHDDMAVRDNELKLKIDGEVHLISAQNEHSYRIIQGLKGDTYNTGPIMNALSRVNRVLAAVNTTLSPEFIISNFTRDLQTAAVNLSDTQISKMKGRVVKDLPKAMKGLHSHLRGDGSHEWAKTAKQFEAAGGRIGWIDFAGDIETRARKLENEIDLFRDGHVTKKSIHKLVKVIEDYNTIVENAVRLSTFKNGVAAGMSQSKAALMAKDLTVNFNQKGVYGPLINSLYLFSNAGIQGSAKILSVLKNSPTARKMVYASMLTASVLSIVNRDVGGDDDDGVPFYDKIPEHVKERNMIFMLPGTGGNYAKIPLPWGYNVFWVTGSEFGDIFTKKGYSPTASLANIMSATAGAFNPLQSSTLLQTISPTVTDPFVQVGENKTWSGSPLMPENNPFSRVKKPDSELFWPSARPLSVAMARGLNEITGGNHIRPGMASISPETLDLVWDTLTGSAGRFAVDTLGLPAQLLKDEPSLSKIPVARRLMGQKADYSDTVTYRDNIAHVFRLCDEIKAFPAKAQDLKKDKTYRLFVTAKKVESDIRKLNKQLKMNKGVVGAQKAIKANIQKRKMKFNEAFNKLKLQAH